MKPLKVVSRLFIVLGFICLGLVFCSWFKHSDLTVMQNFKDNALVYVLSIMFIIGGYVGDPDK